MQKFSLDGILEKTQRSSEMHDIQLEILQEQSSSLGRAGRKLAASITDYNKMCLSNSEAKQDAQLRQIAKDLHALLVQREILGFSNAHMAKITSCYQIPEGVFKYLGSE